jgi:putative ABC transport system permease protein
VSGWPRSSFLWKRIPLAAGRLPVEGEGRAVVVGDFIADALGKTIGDTVDILDEKFRIVGVSKFRTLANRGTIVGPLDELQEVAFRRGQVTLFHVNLRRGLRGAERDALKTQIAGLGPVAVSETAEILRNDRNLSVLRAVSLAISVIALIIGGVNVLNTMLMAVQERTREIGIVVAIGLSDRQIITSILIEGVTLGTLGCCLGVLLGLLASNGFSAIALSGLARDAHRAGRSAPPPVTARSATAGRRKIQQVARPHLRTASIRRFSASAPTAPGTTSPPTT